jgi:hypothetical protein
MATTFLQASNLTLSEVERKFRLQETQDALFFLEWQENLPPLNEEDKRTLDIVKQNFLYQRKESMSEEMVKLVILSPLLQTAGFYSPPFRIQTEHPIEISVKDQDETVRGKIDILVLHKRLWILVIESKQVEFSLHEAIPQALTYMMQDLQQHKSTFGLVTNGSEFRFLKLQYFEQSMPELIDGSPEAHYALSDLFTLQRRSNDLYSVLSILKQLGQLTLKEAI